MGEYGDKKYVLKLLDHNNIQDQVLRGEPLSPMKGFVTKESIPLGDDLEEVQLLYTRIV